MIYARGVKDLLCNPRYYGVGGKRHGLGQENPQDSPMALVIPYLNGSRPSLPAGFAGSVHTVAALKTPHQFCIIAPHVTAFAGSQLKIPTCRPLGVSSGYLQPRFASVLAPSWLTVLGKTNATDPTYTEMAVNQTFTVPAGHGPDAGNGEARLLQVFDGGGRWEIYNDFVRFYVTFSEAHAGKTIAFHVLLHDTLEELEVARSNFLWQEMSMELVATPDLRSQLGLDKTKLMTALVWTDIGLFLNGSTPDGSYSSLETFARLGFNTIPGIVNRCPGCDWRSVNPWDTPLPAWAHPPAPLADEFAYPDNRTAAKGWSGLQYGPMMSGFGRMYAMAKTPQNASLLPRPFVLDEETEMKKWKNAVDFQNALHGGQNMVDLAYDGALVRADIADFCNAVNATRPEWIFVDDEGFPTSWQYAQYGHLSANAAARRLPNESDFDLAYRMVKEFLQMWSECLADMPSASGARTMIGYYDTTFDPGQFQPEGFVAMPSEYDIQKDTRQFGKSIQEYRRRMVHVPQPDGLGPPGQLTKTRQLLPVLTACTYGQADALDVFTGALHTFAGGASGFSFFAGACFDDPGKVLALSTAAALAAPYAEHFFTGTPIVEPDQLRNQSNVLAAAGMRSGLDCWLVVTPARAGEVGLELRLPFAGSSTVAACELISGRAFSFDVEGGAASLRLRALGTVVLHLGDPAVPCAATPLWYPRGRAGAAARDAALAPGVPE